MPNSAQAAIRVLVVLAGAVAALVVSEFVTGIVLSQFMPAEPQGGGTGSILLKGDTRSGSAISLRLRHSC